MRKLKIDKDIIIAWCTFLLFAIILFAKCIMFHWNVYHSLLISSIFSDPMRFWSYWLPKISISIFIASFVFFSKRNWWTIIVSLLIDTWMLANMFYLRSNGILFDGFTFTMTSNMDGYWSSVLALFESKDILPYVFTGFLGVAVWFLDRMRKDNYRKTGCIVLVVSILFNWYVFGLVKQYALRCIHGDVEYHDAHSTLYYMWENPLSYEYRRSIEPMNKDYAFYNFSAIHGFVFVTLDNLHHIYEKNRPLPIENKEELANRLQMGDNQEMKYDNLLLIIIVESLESWTISDTVTPNIQKFINSHPVLYAKYLKSQIVGGSSADGQMIINTGLLPIKQGATCFRYPWIKFPSFVNRQDSTVTILTHSTSAWNQEAMSRAYGYDYTLAGTVDDKILSERVIDYAQRGFRTIQAITVASHVPFEYDDRSRLKLPGEMPSLMMKYLKCLNWTDEGLGYLFDRIDSIPELANATIVVTGDHTIFWPEKRDEFEGYCKRTPYTFDVQKGYVPLIIYSPNVIQEDMVIDDINYQMDIYPTIMSVLGVDDYYWKGFGVNLLDSNARHNRVWTEEQAYLTSDSLIRANWFEIYKE